MALLSSILTLVITSPSTMMTPANGLFQNLHHKVCYSYLLVCPHFRSGSAFVRIISLNGRAIFRIRVSPDRLLGTKARLTTPCLSCKIIKMLNKWQAGRLAQLRSYAANGLFSEIRNQERTKRQLLQMARPGGQTQFLGRSLLNLHGGVWLLDDANISYIYYKPSIPGILRAYANIFFSSAPTVACVWPHPRGCYRVIYADTETPLAEPYAVSDR